MSLVTLRYRARNALSDLIDRTVRWRCCRAPLEFEGYCYWWRCGLRHGHKTPCRSGNYWWGPGGAVYDPDWGFVGQTRRHAVSTRRQMRWLKRHRVLADVRHAQQQSMRESRRVAS